MEKMGALSLGTIPTYILVKWGGGRVPVIAF